jgi:hypothetical protein
MENRLKKSTLALKRKRNLGFFIVFILSLFLLTITYLSFFQFPNSGVLQSVLLLYLIVLIFFSALIRSYFSKINMYIHYYRMIEENLPPFKIKTVPGTVDFHNNLSKFKFIEGIKNSDYTIYFNYLPRLPWVNRTKPSIVFVVLINQNSIEIDDKMVSSHFQKITNNLKLNDTIQNELSLFFFRSEHLNKSLIEKSQKIIHLVFQNRALVSISAILDGNDRMFTLRPSKLFPSKYYYVLIKLLYYLTDSSEML